ncbi:MAG: guanylate kinase [Propionibacteriaceae bacterium]
MTHDTRPAGRLTILSGPTAVGKGTVMARLRVDHPDVWISVSATTRPPRPGEVDGVHYLFLSEAEFDELVATDALLEWAVVHGRHRYGTPRAPVDAALAIGRPALVEVDLQGARQIRRRCPDAKFVFLAPPDRDELVRRLVGRGTEDAAEQERRLQTAEGELAAVDEFDHVVVNGEIAQAVADLVGLLDSPSQHLS